MSKIYPTTMSQQFRYPNIATNFDPASPEYLANTAHTNPDLNLNHIHTNANDFNRPGLVVSGTPVTTDFSGVHVENNPVSTTIGDSTKNKLGKGKLTESRSSSTGSRKKSGTNRTASTSHTVFEAYGQCPPEHLGLPSHLKIVLPLNGGDAIVGDGKFNAYQIPKPYFTKCERVHDPYRNDGKHSRLESSLQVFTHGDKQWEKFIADLSKAKTAYGTTSFFHYFNAITLVLWATSVWAMIFFDALYLIPAVIFGPALLYLACIFFFEIRGSAVNRRALEAIWHGDVAKMSEFKIEGVEATNWERFFEQHGYRAVLSRDKCGSCMRITIMMPHEQFMCVEAV